jgi:hypothetical protein
MMMIMICLLLFTFFLFIAIKSFEAIQEKKEVSVQFGSPKFPYPYLISGKCVEANCPYGAVASHLNGGICYRGYITIILFNLFLYFITCKRNEILESIASLSVQMETLSVSIETLTSTACSLPEFFLVGFYI